MNFAQALVRIEELSSFLNEEIGTEIENLSSLIQMHGELRNLLDYHTSDIVQLSKVAQEMAESVDDEEFIKHCVIYDKLMKGE